MIVQIDHADHVVVCIGHVEFSAGRGQAGGIVECRRGFGIVGLSGAGQCLRVAVDGIDFLDFIVIGVGNIEFALAIDNAQRVLQFDLICEAVSVAEGKQPGFGEMCGADHGADFFTVIEGDCANGTAFGVGDIEPRAV